MAYDIPNYELEANQPPRLPNPKQSTSVKTRKAIKMEDIPNKPTGDEVNIRQADTAQVYTFVESPEGSSGQPQASVEDIEQNPDTPATPNQHAGQVYPHTIKLMLPLGPATLQ